MKTKGCLGLLLIAFILIISSCTDKAQTVGEWNDSIKLSARKADLSATNDSIVITTKGTWWWVNEILVNENYLVFNPTETEKPNFSIKGDWFSVERRNNQQLVVKVAQNKTSQARNIKITLEAGDYFDYVDICQEGTN